MSEIVPQIRQQGLLRFDFLGGCLPGRAAPTDIDMVIERNGHFLVIECKRPGQQIPRGQEITFDRLLELGCGRVRILVIEGHPPADIVACSWWGKQRESCDVQYVRDLASRWYAWATEQRRAA